MPEKKNPRVTQKNCDKIVPKCVSKGMISPELMKKIARIQRQQVSKKSNQNKVVKKIRQAPKQKKQPSFLQHNYRQYMKRRALGKGHTKEEVTEHMKLLGKEWIKSEEYKSAKDGKYVSHKQSSPKTLKTNGPKSLERRKTPKKSPSPEKGGVFKFLGF